MEECQIFLTQQGVPEHSNAAFDRPANNPYSPTYNRGWRNHPNFAWGPQKDQFRPKFSNQASQPQYHQQFPNQSPPTFQNQPMESRLHLWNERWTPF